MSYFLLFLLTLVAAVVPAQRASADAQVSFRNQFEIGQRRYEGKKDLILAGGLRADMMFGWPRPKSFRFGPALELRTTDIETLEAALGAGILIPLPGDMPIGLSGLLGTAVRKGDLPDGVVGIGTVTWGFRGYNTHSWYGYALNLFFSGRKDLKEDLIEYTGGVEIDFVFTTIIPGNAMLTFMKSGDPYEH